jgi:hypothetical protein
MRCSPVLFQTGRRAHRGAEQTPAAPGGAPRAAVRRSEEDQSHAERARFAQPLFPGARQRYLSRDRGERVPPYRVRSRRDPHYRSDGSDLYGPYLYGTHTYFEFFDGARETMGGLGHSGLAFGVDEPGALQQLQEHLAPAFPVEQVTITRQLGDQQIPWFLMMAPENVPASSAVSIWFLEYHPRFLAEWLPPAGDDEGGIRRDQVLRRYAATLAEAPPDPALQDVVGLTIAADPSTRLFLVELCQRLGYRSRAEGEAALLAGPDIALRLVPETASARGIREMTLRVLRAPVRGTKFRFGPDSVLTFRVDGTALWSF